MSYTVDRTRAEQLGLNIQEVANNLNISLSSSEQVSPNFWTDPKNGIP
jgi:multidrug efflux pump subunit AcrB